MNLFIPVLGLFLLQSTVPGGQDGALRNAFRTAAETVVDNAMSINPAASDTEYAVVLGQLKQSQANLTQMVADEREQEIASETNNLIFTISACHIQARSDAKATSCRPNIERAVLGVETLLNSHKVNSAWVDGPPVSDRSNHQNEP